MLNAILVANEEANERRRLEKIMSYLQDNF